MVLTTKQTETRVTCCLDTSGQPQLSSAFCVGCLWFEDRDLRVIARQLQTVRDVHGYQGPIHFSELGKVGARESIARDWVRLALKSPEFPVTGSFLVVPNSGFDLRFYGNSKERAINRVCKTMVLSSIARIDHWVPPLRVQVLVDGQPDKSDGAAHTAEYLRNVIRWEESRRITVPSIVDVASGLVPRRPIGPRNSLRRALQDVTALVDVICGGARTMLELGRAHSAKTELRHLLGARHKLAVSAERSESAIRIEVYRFPARRFQDIDQVLLTMAQ